MVVRALFFSRRVGVAEVWGFVVAITLYLLTIRQLVPRQQRDN
jgi:hypothetical protein